MGEQTGMNCIRCGKKLKKGAIFCQRCGAPAPREEPVSKGSAWVPDQPPASAPPSTLQTGAPEPRKKSPVPILAALAALVVLVGGIALAVHFLGFRDGEETAAAPTAQATTLPSAAPVPTQAPDTAPDDADPAPVEQREANLLLRMGSVSGSPDVQLWASARNLDRESITDLTLEDFSLEENGYERPLTRLSTVAESSLSISLVADSSLSAAPYLSYIEDALCSAVLKLDLWPLHRVEVLTYDRVVRQMCPYTDDIDLLVRGIQSISPDSDGAALYDAIGRAIRNARDKDGPRCVVAFVAQPDTASTQYDVDSLISLATQANVPVFLVCISPDNYSSDMREELGHLAYYTNGNWCAVNGYEYIGGGFDQIIDLILNDYVIEYSPDPDLLPLEPRDLRLTLSSWEYAGTDSAHFAPTLPVWETLDPSRYQVVLGYYTWEEANKLCQEMGGHLATITSPQEQDLIVSLVEEAGGDDITYVWLGGCTSYDIHGDILGYWVTGEDFTYQNWSDGEPSCQDQDGTLESYIMLWNIPRLGGWTWNDQRDDPGAVAPSLQKHAAFVCEFES